ncbi:CHAD domain-containing protein [Embleya scabrispora]|uniref:CHAD domain-containing protein n=1 Tax=Embleya scabrispora TaxID=159449 RepID=UPI00037231B0|nr:CHAD domain-containing protein [Embleya scabrispora]MYS79922.1 CHAD domain-containing protein [Streptomyces sp. SID5474]
MGRTEQTTGIPRQRAAAEDTSAGAILLAHLVGEAGAFIDQLPRLSAGEEEAAHNARVAARRIRSALATCGPLLEPEPAARLRARLREAADALAGERDAEVLLERLSADLDTLPERPGSARARAIVTRRLRGDLGAGRTRALTALGSGVFTTLSADLVEPALGLTFTKRAAAPGAELVPGLVARTLRRLDRAVDALPLAAAGEPYPADRAGFTPYAGTDDDAWHRVRILAKRARYAADMCVPAFGPPAARLARRLKAVTEVLGVHQDATIAADAVAALAAGPRVGGPAAFVLGELYAHERRVATAQRYAFTRVWPRAGAPEARAWLDG